MFLREHFDEVQVRHRDDEHQRNVLLNRWNANLNMIAKWVNTYRSYADVRHVIRQLEALERELALVREPVEQAVIVGFSKYGTGGGYAPGALFDLAHQPG